MKITKYTAKGEHGDVVRYDLTDLHPKSLEALFNGLEMLEAAHKGNTCSWRDLDAMRKFFADVPQSITDNGTHDDAGGAQK